MFNHPPYVIDDINSTDKSKEGRIDQSMQSIRNATVYNIMVLIKFAFVKISSMERITQLNETYVTIQNIFHI